MTSIAALEAYEAAYRALFAASDAAPYLSYDWLHDFLVDQTGGDDVFICIAEDAEGSFAVVPLIARRELFATRLELFADGPATHNTLLVLERGRSVPVLQLACEWLGRHHVKWDYCVVGKIIPERLLSDTPDLHADLMFTGTAAPPSLAIDLPDTWEAYLAGVSRKHRSNVNRCIRNLETTHRVAMRRVGVGLDRGDAAADVERLSEDALAVCGASWQGSFAHGHAICDREIVAFFRRSNLSMAKQGALDLAVLYLDERPVAFSWGATRDGRSWIATSGFDASLRHLSPGLVLDALVIKDSIARGMRQLDWGNEFPDYKQRWCNQSIALSEICLYAHPRVSKLKRRAQERWDRSVRSRLESWRALNAAVVYPVFGVV